MQNYGTKIKATYVVWYLTCRLVFESCSSSWTVASGVPFGHGTHYLSNLHHLVTVEDEFSHLAPVTSGIFQGIILGPFLFLLYNNAFLLLCGMASHFYCPMMMRSCINSTFKKCIPGLPAALTASNGLICGIPLARWSSPRPKLLNDLQMSSTGRGCEVTVNSHWTKRTCTWPGNRSFMQGDIFRTRILPECLSRKVLRTYIISFKLPKIFLLKRLSHTKPFTSIT